MPNFTVLNPLVDTIPSTPHEIRIEDAVAKYSEALNLLCQKDFARARDIFEELIVEFEDEGYDSSDEASETTRAKHLRYLVHKNFSQLLNKCNQPALAIKQAELALSVKHTDAYLWCELGELLLSAHKFPEAVGAFTSGLDLSLSKFTSAKCLRGICEGLFNMGDFESCLLYLEKAIEMDPGYHRGLWIKNKILDEYSGYADFSLKHRGFSGGVFAFSGPASVPRKRANIEDLFDLIKMTNPEYFESLTRERIIPWVDNEKQYEKVKYKVIEVTRKSFYHLGLRLIEELSAILESLKEVCHSPLPLLRIKFSHPAQSDAKSSYSWDKDSAEIPQNIVLQGNYGDSIVSLQKKADTSAADSTLATAPGTGDIQVARKGSPHQGGRRASKRLEGKAKRPESSDYYHYEKIDDIFSDLTNLRYTLGMDSGLFCPEAESTDSVIYDSYMNLLSHPKEAQRQPEERDPGTVDSKCDNRRYNDEAMFGEFIESVLNLECDIIHIARVYCLFAVTECIDLSCHSNYDGVNEKRWCAGTKKNIVKILTEIEKYDMGLNFWIMQTPDNMRNLLFAFVLSLGEVLSDFGNCDFPHDITASDDTGEGFQDYINTCSCPKCLLNGYINALRLINVSSELPMNLVIR